MRTRLTEMNFITNLNIEMKKLFVAVTIACLGIILVSVSVRAGDLAFDRSGNLFVAHYSEIVKFTPDGKKSIFATGLKDARNLIFDSKNDLFAFDHGQKSIFKFTPDGKKSTFATGIDAVVMAFDEADNLFASEAHSEKDHYVGAIFKFTPEGVKSTFASGLQYPSGMAFDAGGNLFVADSGSHALFKFAPDGTRSTFAGVFPSANPGFNTLVFDRSGNLFVADSFDHAIFKFAPDGAKSIFATGIDGVKGLLFDQSGNLIVPIDSPASGSAIFKFTPDGNKSAFSSWLNPDALVFDEAGNLFVSAKGSIFKIAPDGTETTFASGHISPDNQWDYQYTSDGERAGILKAGTKEVALDLSDECQGSVHWSPDSKRFALNCRFGGRFNGGASLYQLRGDKWKTLKSPNDDVQEILDKAIAAQVKKRGLPKKTDLRLIWETLEVRRWVDSNTAIVYGGLEEVVRENLDEGFGADFLLTLKFDAQGNWKIVKTQRTSLEEVEKEDAKEVSGPAKTTEQGGLSADASFRDADHHLNEVYNALRARLSPSERDTLKKEQLAWIDRRNAAGQAAKGNAQENPTDAADREVTKMTLARAAELENG